MKNFKLTITKNALSYLNYLKTTNKNTNTNFRISLRNNKETEKLDLSFSFCYNGEECFTDKKCIYTNFLLYIANQIIKKIAYIDIDYIQNKKLTIKIQNSSTKKFIKNNELQKIKSYITSTINPILKEHNGYIEVLNLQDNTLYIKFSGTCSSCTLVNITLEKFIKKKIINKFKEIKNIEKIKNH